MNKVNKKAVLSIHTADICQRVIIQLRKTLFWSITRKALIINRINGFDACKNTNQFQEPPFLEAHSYVSCRWNRCFYHKEPPLFERKSVEWDCFQHLSLLENAVFCNADLANHRFYFLFREKSWWWFFFTIRQFIRPVRNTFFLKPALGLTPKSHAFLIKPPKNNQSLILLRIWHQAYFPFEINDACRYFHLTSASKVLSRLVL